MMNGLSLFNYSAGVSSVGGSGAPGFIDDGDEITVANYASLPAAADNSGKLAWVLSTTGSLWTKKYSGWYVSDGVTWEPAQLPDDQYVVTAALQADVDNSDTLVIQAYDVNGAAYSTFATFTSADTPTGVISPPSGGTLTVVASNTGLGAYDTNSSHILTIKPGSDLSAARTFTLTTGDADRTLDISAASVTVSSFAATVLDDTTAAAARTTLGVPTATIRLVGFSSVDPTTGQQGTYAVCPVAGTITAWGFQVNAGTATVKTWKVATGTASPTVANLISTSGVSIAANTAVRSTTVTDFTTTSVAAGDFFAFDLTAVSGVDNIFFWIEITPT